MTLPSTAGTGMSRVVIGTDIPEPLASYVWADDGIPAQGSRYIAAIIFYGNLGDNNYSFIGFTGNSNPLFPIYQMHIGAVNQGTVVEQIAGTPAGSVWQFVIDDPTPELRFTDANSTVNMLNEILNISGPLSGIAGEVILHNADWYTSNQFNALYFPYAPDRKVCSANTPVGIANTPIPGTQVFVSPEGTFDIWEVTGYFSIAAIAAPTSEMSGGLLVDGVLQSGSTGPVRMFTNGEKDMVSMTWTVSGLDDSGHDFQLSAVAGAAGNYQINAGDTAIVVKGYYGGQ